MYLPISTLGEVSMLTIASIAVYLYYLNAQCVCFCKLIYSVQLAVDILTWIFGSRFDVDGHVTGFGNPDWARTHSAATSTAPAVLAVLSGGATSIGKTIMDEMAYRLEFKPIHCFSCIGIQFNYVF